MSDENPAAAPGGWPRRQRPLARVDGHTETLEVPAATRAQVLDRDNGNCRVCGAHAENPAVHHIFYRSEGGGPDGLHVLSNLVTVHWMFAPRCHEVVHGSKGLWQPLLAEVVKYDGMTARGLLRAYQGQRGGLR